MRWIYISPHLDDSVLSAGGLIHDQAQRGDSVEIWTILCGIPADSELSPFAEALHAQWNLSSAEHAVRARREEDRAAAAIVGAKPRHFDYLDCIYRRGLEGQWLYSTVFSEPHEDDELLTKAIADSISADLHGDDHVICQFAIGSHVDHVLVRRAVELLDRPHSYLADIPYLFNAPGQLGTNTAGMNEIALPVSDAGLTSWQDAISAYTSQVGMLFADPEDMRVKIGNYRVEAGGVRLWSNDQSNSAIFKH